MSDHVITAPESLLDGIRLSGTVNISEAEILDNVRQNIRRQHPQVAAQPPQRDRIVLLGSGPSLASSVEAIRALMHEGAKIVTVNGAYHWALEHNLHPSAQILVDGRDTNVRFLHPAIPRCRYLLASQVHPSCFDAVEGRPEVSIFHCAVSEANPQTALLNAYYTPGHWVGVPGGTTVMTRALPLLRLLGYLRFDIFGLDCCWLDGQHHAFPQPENEGERRYTVTVTPVGGQPRTFLCSGWHLQQLDDCLQLIRHHGEKWLWRVHGEGLLAFALTATAGCEVQANEISRS